MLDINFYYQIINNFYHLQCSPFKFILIKTQGQHLADFNELHSWKNSLSALWKDKATQYLEESTHSNAHKVLDLNPFSSRWPKQQQKKRIIKQWGLNFIFIPEALNSVSNLLDVDYLNPLKTTFLRSFGFHHSGNKAFLRLCINRCRFRKIM